MKLTKQDIVLGIIAVLIVWNVFNTNKIKTNINNYKQNIENIQTKIDSAQVINKQIDKKIDTVQTKVTTVNEEIRHIDKTIITVKQQTNEKVASINNLSNAELEQFFSSRYNKNLHP